MRIMALDVPTEIHKITFLDEAEMAVIDLKDFQGVFTNADMEDVPVTALEELKNMRPVHGRLIKTNGFGVKINTDFSNTASYVTRNFVVYVADYLTSPADAWVILIEIHSSTGQMKLHGWNGSGWDDITLFSTPYHKAATNPILQERGILRVLPGNVGLLGANEAKGLWLGYIDRDYFDNNYDPSATQYPYPTEIVKPDVTFSLTQIQGGEFTDTVKYYKFSYMYDGIQESLLSDPIVVNFNLADNLFLVLEHTFDRTAQSKRITAMNVYRSDSLAGSYYKIHTIDYLRKSTELLQSADGGYCGTNTVYIPALADYTFVETDDYQIFLRTGAGSFAGNEIQVRDDAGFADPVGTGNKIFHITTDTWASKDLWNVEWYLKKDDAGDSNFVKVFGQTGKNGAYAGENAAILTADTGLHTAAGGILTLVDFKTAKTTEAATAEAGKSTKFTSVGHALVTGDIVVMSGYSTNTLYNGTFVVTKDDDNNFTVPAEFGSDEDGDWALIGDVRIIDDNVGFAVHLATRYGSDGNNRGDYNVAWSLLYPDKGLYIASISGDNITYKIYDKNLTGDTEHPLGLSPSIKVNGEFAKIINGRCFQGNVVLDPGGDHEETYDDILTYSELNQFDVTPVGNILIVSDSMGGPITGVNELFGDVVITKKHSIKRILNTKTYPNDPTKWIINESSHHIGNLADHGLIAVLGALYVCYVDGIYQLSPNNLAASDATPTERLRITDAIGNVYEGLTITEIPDITAEYDNINSEILFNFPFNAGDEVWAYNVNTGSWRQHDTSVTLSLMTNDDNGYLLAYDTSDNKIYSAAEDEASLDISMITKTLRTANKRSVPVHEIIVRYKSDEALTLEVYSDIAFTEGTVTKDYEYRIQDASGDADFTNVGAANKDVGTEFTATSTAEPTSWGTGKLIQISNIKTATLPVSPELTNKTIYVKRYCTELKVKIKTA